MYQKKDKILREIHADMRNRSIAGRKGTPRYAYRENVPSFPMAYRFKRSYRANLQEEARGSEYGFKKKG